jgi:hypothetical protein
VSDKVVILDGVDLSNDRKQEFLRNLVRASKVAVCVMGTNSSNVGDFIVHLEHYNGYTDTSIQEWALLHTEFTRYLPDPATVAGALALRPPALARFVCQQLGLDDTGTPVVASQVKNRPWLCELLLQELQHDAAAVLQDGSRSLDSSLPAVLDRVLAEMRLSIVSYKPTIYSTTGGCRAQYLMHMPINTLRDFSEEKHRVERPYISAAFHPAGFLPDMSLVNCHLFDPATPQSETLYLLDFSNMVAGAGHNWNDYWSPVCRISAAAVEPLLFLALGSAMLEGEAGDSTPVSVACVQRLFRPDRAHMHTTRNRLKGYRMEPRMLDLKVALVGTCFTVASRAGGLRGQPFMDFLRAFLVQLCESGRPLQVEDLIIRDERLRAFLRDGNIRVPFASTACNPFDLGIFGPLRDDGVNVSNLWSDVDASVGIITGDDAATQAPGPVSIESKFNGTAAKRREHVKVSLIVTNTAVWSDDGGNKHIQYHEIHQGKLLEYRESLQQRAEDGVATAVLRRTVDGGRVTMHVDLLFDDLYRGEDAFTGTSAVKQVALVIPRNDLGLVG